MDTIWGSLVLAVLFVVPLISSAQVMRAGYRRGRAAVKVAGFLIVPLLFFAACYTFFMTAAGRATEAGRYVCDAFGALALIVTVAGSILELALALVVWEIIDSRARRHAASGSISNPRLPVI